MTILRSQKGAVLLISLVIITVLLVLGTTVLFALNNETSMINQAELQAKAVYLAQAGIEHGLYLVESAPKGHEPSFPAGAVKVYEEGSSIFEYQISKSGSQIDSIGRIKVNGNVTKEIKLRAIWDASGKVTIIR